MNGTDSFKQTSASQASSGSPNRKLLRAENNGIQRWRPVEIPTEFPAPYQPESYTLDEVGQLLSWIQDTLAAHDEEYRSFLKAVNTIATLDEEGITGIFGDDEEKPTDEQARVFKLAKALSNHYRNEGVLE